MSPRLWKRQKIATLLPKLIVGLTKRKQKEAERLLGLCDERMREQVLLADCRIRWFLETITREQIRLDTIPEGKGPRPTWHSSSTRDTITLFPGDIDREFREIAYNHLTVPNAEDPRRLDLPAEPMTVEAILPGYYRGHYRQPGDRFKLRNARRNFSFAWMKRDGSNDATKPAMIVKDSRETVSFTLFPFSPKVTLSDYRNTTREKLARARQIVDKARTRLGFAVNFYQTRDQGSPSISQREVEDLLLTIFQTASSTTKSDAAVRTVDFLRLADPQRSISSPGSLRVRSCPSQNQAR